MEDSYLTSGIKFEEIKSDIIVCIDCDHIFQSDAHFFSHGQSCQPQNYQPNEDTKPKEKRVFSCTVCFNVYSTKKQLVIHAKLAHNVELAKICPFCGRTLKNGSTVTRLYRHVMKRHDAEKESDQFKSIVEEFVSNRPSERIQCDKCGNYYANVNSLDNHKRDRHGSETYICSICGASFKSKRDLESHKISHNQATIPCEHCGQVYKRRTHLNRHIKIVHLQIRNHKCDICDKRFRSQKDVRNHITAIHDKLKPFACVECEFRCAKYSNLNLHRQKKHGIPTMLKTHYDELLAKGEHPFINMNEQKK